MLRSFFNIAATFALLSLASAKLVRADAVDPSSGDSVGGGRRTASASR